MSVTARRTGASLSARSGTAERYDRGVGLRRKTPRQKHAELLGPPDRDPVAILARGDRTRVPELVPVRYERMLTSPFAFLRGAAAVMAEDLRHQPTAGVPVQACGDCHLMNFGAFATPEDAHFGWAGSHAVQTVVAHLKELLAPNTAMLAEKTPGRIKCEAADSA